MNIIKSESGDSGHFGISGHSGKSDDYGESDDSGESDDFGESDDSGELWKEVSQESEKLLAFSPIKFRSSKLSDPPIPCISPAMAMAMSIFRTLCVLVEMK